MQISYTLSCPTAHVEVIAFNGSHDVKLKWELIKGLSCIYHINTHIYTDSYTKTKSMQLQASFAEPLKVAAARTKDNWELNIQCSVLL